MHNVRAWPLLLIPGRPLVFKGLPAEKEGKGGAEIGRMRILACGPRTDPEAMNQGECRLKLMEFPMGNGSFGKRWSVRGREEPPLW